MAAGIAGIWNHAAHASSVARPMDTTVGSASSDGSSISANDFLTLLVTEMQNQDPTANTDPNEYINQLVQVNSLEQLISINQTLTTDSGGRTTSTSGEDAQQTGTAPMKSVANNSTTASMPTSPSSSAIPAPAQFAAGNLTIPGANPAALRIATSLAGQSGR